MLSELTGRSIRRVVADDEQWTAGPIAPGVPEDQATVLLGMFWHPAAANSQPSTRPWRSCSVDLRSRSGRCSKASF
ncbi:MAG: hypothetical protein ABJD68_03315 [Nakamurella sp.]